MERGKEGGEGVRGGRRPPPSADCSAGSSEVQNQELNKRPMKAEFERTEPLSEGSSTSGSGELITVLYSSFGVSLTSIPDAPSLLETESRMSRWLKPALMPPHQGPGQALRMERNPIKSQAGAQRSPQGAAAPQTPP